MPSASVTFSARRPSPDAYFSGHYLKRDSSRATAALNPDRFEETAISALTYVASMLALNLITELPDGYDGAPGEKRQCSDRLSLSSSSQLPFPLAALAARDGTFEPGDLEDPTQWAAGKPDACLS
jgi:hypothetical protein